MSIALIVFVIVIIALIVICYAAAAFSYYNKEAKKEIRPTKLYLAGPITGVSNAKAKFELAAVKVTVDTPEAADFLLHAKNKINFKLFNDEK